MELLACNDIIALESMVISIVLWTSTYTKLIPSIAQTVIGAAWLPCTEE